MKPQIQWRNESSFDFIPLGGCYKWMKLLINGGILNVYYSKRSGAEDFKP